MNAAKRQVLENEIAQARRSMSAQEELVAGEAEAALDHNGNDKYTERDVKNAIIAMNNVIIFARQLRIKLRRALQ